MDKCQDMEKKHPPFSYGLHKCKYGRCYCYVKYSARVVDSRTLSPITHSQISFDVFYKLFVIEVNTHTRDNLLYKNGA